MTIDELEKEVISRIELFMLSGENIPPQSEVDGKPYFVQACESVKEVFDAYRRTANGDSQVVAST